MRLHLRLPTRLTVLRTACVAALAASAALTADSWHHERGFCPLQSACARARESALGSVFGIPTSVLGMMAFGGLFLFSILPAARARRLAKPAALAGAFAGTGLAAYQALALKIFCPLCVVADVSALIAGATVIGWKAPKARRKKGKARPPVTEFVGTRLRWALAAGLAVVVPVAWPRETRPAWTTIDRPIAFADDPTEAFDAPMPAPEPSSPRRDAAETPIERARPRPTPPPPPTAGWAGDAAVVAPPPSTPRPEPVAPPAPPPPAPSRATITIVEYLNPFCAHCRATHARLDRLVPTLDVDVRRRRVYVWAQDEPPLWAKTLSCARGVGLEDRFFEELVRTSGQDRGAIEAAAARAGLDPTTLGACRASAATMERLQRERDTVMAAGIEALPTFDVGRRRLMGEQSEAELREAIDAARPGLSH